MSEDKKSYTIGELVSMQGHKLHQGEPAAEEQPEREDRVPFQYDDDEFEPAGFERIRRDRPHRAPRENDGRGRRPNRSGKPLW